MKILYFGKICDEDLFKKKEKKKQPFFIAQYMFEKALYEGLIETEGINIEVVSIYQSEYFPKDSLIFKNKNSGKFKFKYLSYINIPYLREFSYFFTTCIFILNWYFSNRGISNKCIYSSCHFPPVSLGIVLMGKLLSIKKIVTFTDLSLFSYSKEKISNMKVYKKIFMKPYLWIVNKLQRSYDAYILFSKEMNTIVNSKNKPYLVMEGIYNSENLEMEVPNIKFNAIAHAGTLNKEVGIKKILDVFELIKDETMELWLIGNGDMTEEIIRRSEVDNRIKYLGFMPRNMTFEKLKSAKLLVNLRDPDDIYTKYSFPSKMFEYMASSTPVLTTKIGGIPEQYYNYVYTL